MNGDAQLKRSQPEKLCNKRHTVDIRDMDEMRIQQAADNPGKCDSNIFIAHVCTNNICDSSPESLVHYITP